MILRSALASALALLGLAAAGTAAGQTYSKTEVYTYNDNTSIWVIGQSATVSCVASTPASTACDGDVVSATAYDATYALPVTSSSFGLLQATYAYDTTSLVSTGQRGTFYSVTDGNNKTTTYTSWVRGIPQLVSFPISGQSRSAVVDPATGWISSATDELQSKTCYTYDAMGRIATLTYPSEAAANTCNSSTWTQTTRSFVKVATTEYGIPAGHWRETITTGAGVKVTYYDALWRPILLRQYDASNLTGTESFVKKTFDSAGRATFASYPSASSAPSTGVWSIYDALGRTISIGQDSELTPSQLITTTSYDAGFTTTVTNPRGFQAITTYQTFDAPGTDAPVGIINAVGRPEQQTTTITRDPFGKPLTITRSGTGS